MNEILIATNMVATYSNALLALLLPRVGEFAQKLDLPERQCTMADVRRFVPSNYQLGGGFFFKNGDWYCLANGYVDSFRTPHAYYALQEPELVPKFYGPVNMTRSEVVALARSAISRLGYSGEQLYADLEPEVNNPVDMWSNTIPHFRVTWLIPNACAAVPSVEIEVNAAARRIESVFLANPILKRDPPRLPGVIVTNALGPRESPLAEARGLMLDALPKISDFARTLDLPVASRLTTNQIATFRSSHGDGLTTSTITTREGFAFTVVEGHVVEWASADRFFDSTRTVKVKDFFGKWKMSDVEAIALARRTLVRLGVRKALTVGPPAKFYKPFGAVRDLIPRCIVQWEPKEEHGLLQVEVDGAAGTVKSVTIW
jgi:hypothetical protein